MRSISQEHEKTVRNHIRRLIIMDGKITNIEISKQLEKAGIKPNHPNWVGLQRKKIIREKLATALHYTIQEYLQNFIDTLTEADRRLWQIATDRESSPGEKIYALGEIRKNREAVFDKLFEAGIFSKQLGNLNLRSFMDVVKQATAYVGDEDIRVIEQGAPQGDRALAAEPGGGNQSPVGQGLADLVRASTDPVVDTSPSQDGGA